MGGILAHAEGPHNDGNGHVDHGSVQQHGDDAENDREGHEGPVFGTIAFEQDLDGGVLHARLNPALAAERGGSGISGGGRATTVPV